MEPDELFESELRSAGDLAGVFESENDVAYFYLYDMAGGTDRRIRDAIRILTGAPDFDQGDISVRWDDGETMVGLFIRGPALGGIRHPRRSEIRRRLPANG